MKRTAIGICMLAVLSGAAIAAQLYRWVDENGRVEWRDTPPPSTAKKVEQRRLGGLGTAQTSDLPFSVQQAMKNYPVTLWNSTCGTPCDQARAHLTRRGVPYTEKDPQADVEAFRKLTGGLEVPVLYIGTMRIKGYVDTEWDAMLDTAGYPRTAALGTKPPAKGGAAKAAPRSLPPVTLYTHPECGTPCADAKVLLTDRKVAFEEIVVQEQNAAEALQKISGDTRVPVLLVGQSVSRGFSISDYHQALDAAGFPRP